MGLAVHAARQGKALWKRTDERDKAGWHTIKRRMAVLPVTSTPTFLLKWSCSCPRMPTNLFCKVIKNEQFASAVIFIHEISMAHRLP